MGVKSDWEPPRAAWFPVPVLTDAATSEAGASDIPATVDGDIDPLAGLRPEELGRVARDAGRRALLALADRVEHGHPSALTEPLAATALLEHLRIRGTLSGAVLLAAWRDRIARSTDPRHRYPWDPAPDDRSVIVPVALADSVELLLELDADGPDPLAPTARAILEELRPAIDDDLAESIRATDPRSDTRTLWALARRPRALDELWVLALAVATRYATLARRTSGLLFAGRRPVAGPPLVSASAQLGIGLWALGIYPSLLGGILEMLDRRRRDDGSWSDSDDGVDVPATVAAAELMAALDPGFDPTATVEWLARQQEPVGRWRHVGREWPWLTAATVTWLERVERPFAERFAWPAVPKTSRDRKTGMPRYEYLADLAHALRSMSGLGRLPVEVAFCDLARFGSFNTARGQEAGDEVLRFVAHELVERFPGCRVIRDGGDEFILVGAPTRGGLGTDLRAFCAAWPGRFGDRFGTDLEVVAPRFTWLATTGDRLLAARERLGIRIGELKRVDPPESGLVDDLPTADAGDPA